MKRDESRIIAGHVIAAIRGVTDPVEQNRIAARIIRDEVNQLLGLEGSPEVQIEKLKERIQQLQTDLLHADRAIGRRVIRNVELVKELHSAKKASGT